MSVEKIIGVAGGLGPAASDLLVRKITENTVNNGRDQEHLKKIYISDPVVPDRSEYLERLRRGELIRPEDNPALVVATTMRAIEAAAKVYKAKEVFVVIPCNTFHAPPIWDQLTQALIDQKIRRVRPLHMIREAVNMISEVAPDARKIGLISTTGTRNLRIYRDLLEPLGYEVLEVPEKMQSQVHDTIYNKEWGLKAKSSPVTRKARNNCVRFIKHLAEEGAQAGVLGCTEIPLALTEKRLMGMYLIDPMDAGARALIRAVDRDKVIPLELDL